MHRSGQIRSHWKQMMHRSLPVSGSMGRASSPWNRCETSRRSTGYLTVTLWRSMTRNVNARPVASAVTARATRFNTAASLRLPIYVREHDVDAPQDSDHIRHLPPLHHLGERVQVAEGRGADFDAIRRLGAVAHQVDAEITTRRFGAH